MRLTLNIDEEIAAKVSRIAEARDMTVEAMVAEYLAGLANDDKADRCAHAARLNDTFDRLSRDIGPRTWTRDELYEDRLG